MGAVDAAGDLVLDGPEDGVDLGGALAIDDFELLAAFGEDLGLENPLFQGRRRAVEVDAAIGALVVGDIGMLHHTVQGVLGIDAEPELCGWC